MEPSKVPFTISYSKLGTRPPLYVAGTFTDPEWAPQEMQHVPGTDGELIFKAEVFVIPGKDYQFKFRLGDGNWWALDENLPIVSDDAGNQNNLLKVPPSAGRSSQVTFEKQQASPDESHNTTSLLTRLPSRPKSLAANLASELEVQAEAERSSTPIAQVASTAAEVADVAAILDADDENEIPPGTAGNINGVNIHDTDHLRTPLFAHESLGAYEFVDDGFDHDPLEDVNQRRFSKSLKDCFLSDNPDLSDPTLEKFPSERSSIFDALRKIQTTLDDDVIQADVQWGTSYDSSSRTSLDSADDFTLSPCSLSPTTTRRRDSRLSHSSVGRNKSAVSLGSIAEEDQQRSNTQAGLKPPSGLGLSMQDRPSKKVVPEPQKGDDESWLAMSSTQTGPSSGYQYQSSGTKENDAQPRSASKKSKKKSGKNQGAGLEGSNSSSSNGGRHGSQPRFITNVFEDSRTNLVAAGGLVVLVVGIVWFKYR